MRGTAPELEIGGASIHPFQDWARSDKSGPINAFGSGLGDSIQTFVFMGPGLSASRSPGNGWAPDH